MTGYNCEKVLDIHVEKIKNIVMKLPTMHLFIKKQNFERLGFVYYMKMHCSSLPFNFFPLLMNLLSFYEHLLL